jgi:hypothetical protein
MEWAVKCDSEAVFIEASVVFIGVKGETPKLNAKRRHSYDRVGIRFSFFSPCFGNMDVFLVHVLPAVAIKVCVVVVMPARPCRNC